MNEGPFLFIVGRGRSGTTLLQAFLDSHPDLAIPPESHLVVRIARRRRRYERPGGFDIDRLVSDLVSHYGFRRWQLPVEMVGESLRSAPPGSAADAVRALYRLYARRFGKTRIGDKTPINVMHVARLSRFLPESRFVHVIRDGRDVALSYLDQPFGADSVVEAAFRWRRDVSAGRRAGHRLGPERYREVRYEALVDDVEAELRPLCDFIDLPFDAQMLDYRQHGGRVLSSKIRPAHEHLQLGPVKGLRDWRRDMSPADVAAFEAIAGDLLAELGYERAFPRPSLGTRLAARTVLVGLHARRARWKLRGRRRTNTPPGDGAPRGVRVAG